MLISFPVWEMRATAILARFNFLLVLPVLLLFSACGELSEYDNQRIHEALQDSLLATTESKEIDMTILEKGVIKLNLKASYAKSYRDENVNQTELSGPVHIQIFDDNGKIQTTVFSDSALYKPESVIFELFGHVVANTADGKSLRSEYLKWDRDMDRISTPEFVIFISPPDSIAANGFFGNTDLTDYTLNEGGGQAIIN